jgi:hypothetical protein
MEEIRPETVAHEGACPHCGKNDHHCCHGHWHWGGRFFVVRLVLLLVILVITFGVGLKLGEFRGELAGQGFGMRHGFMQMRGRGMYGGGMMRFVPQRQTFPQSAPVQPATPAQ